MNWEIYALRYGFQERRVRDNFVHAPDPHDAEMPLDYFVWLLRAGTREILVDTGFGPEAAERRKAHGGRRHILRPVDQALRAAGANLNQIADVVITLRDGHIEQVTQRPGR